MSTTTDQVNKTAAVNSLDKSTVKDETLEVPVQNPNDIRVELVNEKDGDEVLKLLKEFFFKVCENIRRCVVNGAEISKPMPFCGIS